MALEEGSSADSDVATWLKRNNLEPLIQVFTERSIALDELQEIAEGDEELKSFAQELSNDVNIQQNLIKAAKQLYLSAAQSAAVADSNDLHIAAPDIAAPSVSYPTPLQPTQHVIVSPAEHQAISDLYERYEQVSNLRTEIQKQSEPLSLSTESAIQNIQQLFDNILLPQIQRQKQQLLGSIDQLASSKQVQLKQQLSAVQEYLQIVDKGKKQYDAYIDNSALDMNTRKQVIVKMTSDIMNHSAAYNSFITQPQVRFNDYTPDLNKLFATFVVDDCDQPQSPEVRIKKFEFSSISLEWQMNNVDLDGAKPVLEFEIEYANLPKSFRQKISMKDALKKAKKMEKKKGKKHKKKSKKDRKKKKKKEKKEKRKKKKQQMQERKKKKKMKGTSKNAEESDEADSGRESDVDTETDSDSDSSSSSDSGYSSDTDTEEDSASDSDSDDDDDDDDAKRGMLDEEEIDELVVLDFDLNQIEDSERESLKWIKNEKKFKVKPRDLKKNKFKYTVEDLRDEHPYIVRIRGRNDSGWGKYSKIIKFQTQKLVIQSNILDNKMRIQLMKWVPNGKRRRWRRIFRAVKDGYTAMNFHGKCDGHGPTVVVIQSSIGNVFGAYTSVKWSSTGNYQFDKDAFLFLLKSKQRKHEKPQKWGVNPSNQNSVYHNSGYGPTFGGGHDLYVVSNCNTSNSSYSSLGNSYAAPKDNNLLAGSYNFTVTDFEVFEITKK